MSAWDEEREGGSGALRKLLVKRTWPGCGVEGRHSSPPQLGPKTPDLAPQTLSVASAGQLAHGQSAQGRPTSIQGSIDFPAKRSRMGHSAPAASWGKQGQPQPGGASQSSSTTAVGLGSQHGWGRRQPDGVPDSTPWPDPPVNSSLSGAQWTPQTAAHQACSWPLAGAGLQRPQQHAAAAWQPAARPAWSSALHAAPSTTQPAWPEQHAPGHVSSTPPTLGSPAIWHVPAGAQPASVLTLIGQPGQLGHPGQRAPGPAQHMNTAPAAHGHRAPAKAAPAAQGPASTSYIAGCIPGLAPVAAPVQRASAPCATGRGGAGNSVVNTLPRAHQPAQPGRAQTAPARKLDAEQHFLPARSPPLRMQLDEWELPSSIVQVTYAVRTCLCHVSANTVTGCPAPGGFASDWLCTDHSGVDNTKPALPHLPGKKLESARSELSVRHWQARHWS